METFDKVLAAICNTISALCFLALVAFVIFATVNVLTRIA